MPSLHCAPAVALRSFARPRAFADKREALEAFGHTRLSAICTQTATHTWQVLGREQQLEEICSVAAQLRLLMRLYPDSCDSAGLHEAFALGNVSALETELHDRLCARVPLYPVDERCDRLMYDPMVWEHPIDTLEDLPLAISVWVLMWGNDLGGEALKRVQTAGGIGCPLPAFDWHGVLDMRRFEHACTLAAAAATDADHRALWPHLPLLAKYVNYDTGNVFLDVDEEDPRALEVLPDTFALGTVRHVDRVAREAGRIFKTVLATAEQLDAQPELWPRIFALWRSAIRSNR